MPKLLLYTLFLSLLTFSTVQAQRYTIEVPNTKVALNQALQLNLVADGAQIRQPPRFPDLPNFRRGSQSNSTMMQIVNGQRSVKHTLTQTYRPTKKGTFKIPAFTLTVNGEKVRFAGTTVTVTAPVKQQARRRRSLFDEFFGRNRSEPPAEEEYMEVKDNAFFSIRSDKDEVYQGEGFTLTLAFYIAEGNRVVKFSDDLGKQLEKILQEIKPDNCWEEVIDLQGNNTQRVSISGKPYRKVTFYKAFYFPFSQEDIFIPSQGVEMVKFKLSKQRDVFGRQYGKRGEKYFFSQPVEVKVKPLPPHPLQERVAVGQFRLTEKADKTFGETGESLRYRFTVRGTGNANAIAAPEPPETHVFDIYPPTSRTTVRRSGGNLLSEKRFDYQLVLNEPGKHRFGDYFKWVYFDPQREVYDTLRSELVVNARGESLRNAAIESNILGGFYDRLTQQDNDLTRQQGTALNWVLNISLLLFILVVGYFIARR